VKLIHNQLGDFEGELGFWFRDSNADQTNIRQDEQPGTEYGRSSRQEAELDSKKRVRGFSEEAGSV